MISSAPLPQQEVGRLDRLGGSPRRTSADHMEASPAVASPAVAVLGVGVGSLVEQRLHISEVAVVSSQ